MACQGAEEREFGGFAQYSVRDLARLVAGRGEILTMSQATVQRILAALVLKPHRLRYFLTRTDPQFEEKMAEIIETLASLLGLYAARSLWRTFSVFVRPSF